MPDNNTIQPIFILPEDTKRTSGKDAQRNNIAAAKAVAATVRTTLGPKGMDKMIVDSMGDVIVTNDGVTILREMHVEHPAAKMIVEVAKTQEVAVGDGTTTAVILAGELLRRAEDLLDQNIHPTVIARGYRLAHTKAVKLMEMMSQKVFITDRELLEKIAMTAMTGKGAEAHKEMLSHLAVSAISQIVGEIDGKRNVDLANIKVEKKVGDSIGLSSLVLGLVLEKERMHSSMPEQVGDATIALLDASLEIKNTEIDAKIQITDPSQLSAFLEQEERTLRLMVKKIEEVGARVVFCSRGVDDLAAHFLAKAGILAVRRVKKSDMEKLAAATGARMVCSWKDLNNADLGFAGIVCERKVVDQEFIYVERCKNPKAVTILVCGGTEHVAKEVARAMNDALGDLAASVNSGRIVAGAGACEMELSCGILAYSRTLQGREQLAVEAFGQAMEIVARTLAENAGLDPIDLMAQLRLAHGRGEVRAGVDVFAGRVMDSWQAGVIEPLKVKTQALSSAVEVAEMILRIDDVIMGASQGRREVGPSMGPDGM